MAKKIDPKAKAKRQKIFAAAGGVILLGVLAFQIPRTMKLLHQSSASASPAQTTATTSGTDSTGGAIAPPTLLAQASRLNFSTRLFNLIVTNIPGPQFPLYVLGREMLEAYPVAFLPENHALDIAIMSYNGQMNFGLLGDFDALPDIDAIGDHIAEELAGLVAMARGKTPAAV